MTTSSTSSTSTPPRRPGELRSRGGMPLLRWGCVGLLMLPFLLGMVIIVAQTAITFANGPWVFAWATVLACATTFPFGLAILWLDRNEPEPLYLVTAAFVWGAVVATGYSLVFNTTFGIAASGYFQDAFIANQLTASISAPFAEELTKGTAVMFIFFLFRHEFDNVLDGMLYGALVGLGFAWLENILYYVQAGQAARPGQVITDMAQLAYIRGLLNGVSSHVSYTALTGMGFGLVRVSRQGILRWLFVPLFWGLAMFAHFLWNTFVGPLIYVTGIETETLQLLVAFPLAVAVLQAPFMLILGITGIVSWFQEARVIRQYLETEPPHIVLPTDVRGLVPARRRLFVSLRRYFTQGPIVWWHGLRLDRTLVRLAFSKWHHDLDPGIDWPADEDAEIAELRARVLRLRRKMQR